MKSPAIVPDECRDALSSVNSHSDWGIYWQRGRNNAWSCFRTYSALLLLMIGLLVTIPAAQAQSVLFDFDSGPNHTSTPLTQIAGGIVAQFTDAGPGHSIQPADSLGFTPVGFSGLCLYPNSVFASDLLISFDTPLKALSILYAPEEYATDSSCTMRITGYMGSTFVGTNTFSNPNPGTWPTATLSFASAQPFDNVVIHYDQPPITGGDYGPIFMADNLVVTPVIGVVPETGSIALLTLGVGMLVGGLVIRRRNHF